MQRRLEDLWPLLAGLTLACTMQIGIAQVQHPRGSLFRIISVGRREFALGPHSAGSVNRRDFCVSLEPVEADVRGAMFGHATKPAKKLVCTSPA